MLTLRLDRVGQRGANLLCLGAHCDDLEIGCSGTVMSLADTHRAGRVTWVVFSGDAQRAAEARGSAAKILGNVGQLDVTVKKFRDGFFPALTAEIKEEFEALKRAVSPDVIFTHCRHDLHQDHRIIAELTWNTFRDH